MRAQRIAQEKSKALAATAVAKIGKPVLIATALLFVGWFFLDYFSLRAPFLGIKIHPTFWHTIGEVSAAMDAMENPLRGIAEATRENNTGIYGVFAILCLAGPLLPLIWKDKRAFLCTLLPLLFTLLLALQCYRVVADVAAMQEQAGAAIIGQADSSHLSFQQLQQREAIKAQLEAEAERNRKAMNFHLGFGFYLSSAATLFLAGAGARKYLALKASPGLPASSGGW